MLSRFDDTTVQQEDVILTTKRSYMKEILIRQLSESDDLNNFDFLGSAFFSKFSSSLSTGGMAHVSASLDDRTASNVGDIELHVNSHGNFPAMSMEDNHLGDQLGGSHHSGQDEPVLDEREVSQYFQFDKNDTSRRKSSH